MQWLIAVYQSVLTWGPITEKVLRVKKLNWLKCAVAQTYSFLIPDSCCEHLKLGPLEHEADARTTTQAGPCNTYFYLGPIYLGICHF
jgi:hypothetical protein